MPNSASAKKRLRQNVVRRARNRPLKSSVRTQMKKVIAAAEAGDVAKAEEEFKIAAKKLDQAGSKGVFHKNSTARKKSRLQRIIMKAKSAG